MVTSLRNIAEERILGLVENQFLCRHFLAWLISKKAHPISTQLRDPQLRGCHHRNVGRGDSLLNHDTDRLGWARLEI